jgi:hypothetical protein
MATYVPYSDHPLILWNPMNNSLDVKKILKQALDAVAGAGIPDDLKPLAFEKAIDLYAGSGAIPAAGGGRATGGGGGDGGGSSSSGAGAALAEESTAIQTIGAKMKIDGATADEVYEIDDEGLRIVLGTSKFEPAKRAATKQLALLYAAGRQAAGLEEWTPVKDVREIVKDFNRFDTANFAYTIAQMDDVFLFRGSSAQSREVKVNRHGYEQAAELIRQLTGSS